MAPRRATAGYLLGALILAVRGRRSLGVAPWAPSIVIPRMREAWVEHRARFADHPPPRPDEPPDWRRELLPLAAIAFAAAVTPIWSRTAGGLPPQLYIGRFAVLLLAACALLRVGRLPRLAGRRWLTAGTACLVGLGRLLSWLLTNAASVGCVRCAGSASGVAEFTFAAILVAFLCIDNAAVRRFAVPLTLLAPAVAIILSIPAVVRFWRPTGSPSPPQPAGTEPGTSTCSCRTFRPLSGSSETRTPAWAAAPSARAACWPGAWSSAACPSSR